MGSPINKKGKNLVESCFCSLRSIWLERNNIIFDGSVESVTGIWEGSNLKLSYSLCLTSFKG